MNIPRSPLAPVCGSTGRKIFSPVRESVVRTDRGGGSDRGFSVRAARARSPNGEADCAVDDA